MPMLLGLLKGAIGSMIASLATEAMVKWLLLWAAEIVVKSTKTPYDDKFLAKIKEELDA